jgi:hypothetical protein
MTACPSSVTYMYSIWWGGMTRDRAALVCVVHRWGGLTARPSPSSVPLFVAFQMTQGALPDQTRAALPSCLTPPHPDQTRRCCHPALPFAVTHRDVPHLKIIA